MNEIIKSEWQTKTLPDGTLSIIGYKGQDKIIIIPAEISGISVSEIAEEAFWGNEQLTELTVSDGIKEIGSSAFLLCSNLKFLHLPDSLERIRQDAFSMCSGLLKLFIPQNVVFIGQNAFAMCEKLIDIEVSPSNKIFVVQDGILYNKENNSIITCSKAVSGKLHLPSDTFGIASYAFFGCNQITEFVLPNGLRFIGENAFASCDKIEHVFIPDTVEHIEALAFDMCSNLQDVSIREKCKFEKGSFCPFNNGVDIIVRHQLGRTEYILGESKDV